MFWHLPWQVEEVDRQVEEVDPGVEVDHLHPFSSWVEPVVVEVVQVSWKVVEAVQVEQVVEEVEQVYSRVDLN